jgi:hypothetical protein
VNYKGSCHCGAVSFEVDGEIKNAMACNCSMCSRRGSLLWFVTPDKFRLLTPEGAASTYTFNKHVSHRFCPRGIHATVRGRPEGNRMVAINIRCLEGIDLATIPVKNFDGRSL